MLIFVYGDDGVQLKAKVLELTTRFLEKFDATGMNLAQFPFGQEKLSYPDVLQAVQSGPFLSEKRMVVVHDLMDGLKKDDARQWAEGLAHIPSSTIVVLVDEAPKATIEKHELFKLLQSQAEVHAYTQVKREGVTLHRWLVDAAKERRASMNLDVAAYLAAKVGDDVWQLTQEVAKLAAYAKNEPITKEMVDTLVRGSTEGNIFAFVDALSQGDAKKAMQLFRDERDAGSADFYLLSMIGRQIRILLQIRVLLTDDPAAERNGFAKQLGLHPYVAQKSLAQAKRVSLVKLQSLHMLLTKLDRDAKHGAIAPDVAIDRLVAEMLMI